MKAPSFWQYPMNWLVVGLPLAAVLASFATLFIALANPDPVVRPRPAASAERPALEGRNHAATGGAPAASAVPAGR